MDSPNNLDDYNLQETIKRTIITQPTIQDANIWEKPDKKPNVDAKEKNKGPGCLSFFVIITIYSLIPSMISLVTSNHAIALSLTVFLVFIVLTGVRETYSNSIADLYIVTASSNYETIQTNRIKHDYKRIPSGSRLAHLYDPRPEADPEGNWYIYIFQNLIVLLMGRNFAILNILKNV